MVHRPATSVTQMLTIVLMIQPYENISVSGQIRRIHKNGGRTGEPGVEHENEAF